VSITLFAYSLPEPFLARIRQRQWGSWLPARAWSWKRFGELILLRVGFFAIDIVYVLLGLWVVGVRVDALLAMSAAPLVALVDGLPISVSGLGTREATLLLLLDPAQPALVVAFCLTWTGFTILGRGLIGGVSIWLDPALAREAGEPRSDKHLVPLDVVPPPHGESGQRKCVDRCRHDPAAEPSTSRPE
jgi:hypothetical protein